MFIRVFLVDDHAVIRDGLRLILESQVDIRVVGEAANGREAVQQVQESVPDVVIMDIAMPELNGMEATKQICQTCPDTRVIILSMHASTDSIRYILEVGARGYILKESAGKEVIDAVRAVYAGRRYLGQNIVEILTNDYMLKDQGPRDSLSLLSSREREVLQLLVEGHTSADIAGITFLSRKTVETYRSRIKKKLRIYDLPGLVRFALKHDLTVS